MAAAVPRLAGTALYGMLATLGVFLVVICSALMRGLQIPCGCLGPWRHDLWAALAIDIVLLVMTAIMLRWGHRRPSAA